MACPGIRVANFMPCQSGPCGHAPKAGTFDHPEVRPGVRPELLAETQAIVFPAGITLSALAAEIFYFDVILHSSAPGTFYLGAGALAAIVMSLIASLSDLNSTASIIAGEAKARIILLSASISFALLLCLFNLLNISGSFPWGWFALWYSFSVVFLLAARCGILLWARLLKAETRLLQRVAIYGSIDLAARVRDQLFTRDSNLVLSGIFTDDVPSVRPAFSAAEWNPHQRRSKRRLRPDHSGDAVGGKGADPRNDRRA